MSRSKLTGWRRSIILRVWLWGGLLGVSGPALAEEPAPCRVIQQEKQVQLQSPFFVFCPDTSAGLRSESWTNRLTGRKISLGNGPELELDLGLPDHPLQTPLLEISAVQVKNEGKAGEVVFVLAAGAPALTATVTYRWDAGHPVLHKFVELTNRSGDEWNRLLNVRVGSYRTDARIEQPKIDKPEQSFPVFLDDEFFMTLAHPAGWATGGDGEVSLRQYPGAKLVPAERFACMEAIYGIAEAGAARKGFVSHLRGRMRRVVRAHDKPCAIFELFGAIPDDPSFAKDKRPYWTARFEENEEFVLDNIAKVARGQREDGCHFDYYSVDFWTEYHGDLKRFDPKNFPRGLTRIREELAKLGTAPGLWFDGAYEGWSIGGNPAVRGTLNFDPKKGPEGLPSFCRAIEPIRSIYTEACLYHIRENGVRLLKFDNFSGVCNNPNHDHLPGIYSAEAIDNAVIEFLQALDRECPDVFLMLYTDYISPWWLLYGDTIFDAGFWIEGASFSSQPAPCARDSVTLRLDQAQRRVLDYVPTLGKDSLGIWLSDWGPWNSQIGKERWPEGMIMDLGRGSLLLQPWSDTPWLSPPERKQMAEFIALLKARPECFGNSRPVLGDPLKNEPYGYFCPDGKRAFLAVSNSCWKDSTLTLELNAAWGLPDGQSWNLYRWYPEPAKLEDGQPAFGSQARIALRPFEVVLLEVVPQGTPPSLDRRFEPRPMPTTFVESSRPIDLRVDANWFDTASPRLVVVSGESPASRDGGTLVIYAQMTYNRWGGRLEALEPTAENGLIAFGGPGLHLSGAGKLAGQAAPWQPVLGTVTYPSTWQAWRLTVGPSTTPQPVELKITTSLPKEVQLICRGYFIPE